eukprot:CAMPEP_0171938010 /NCGR_PEP_ID=MMETSP0993-20121228/35089_1 /TAXON_ID=483369 /ORGANISM="non described non described, Strain CCMP2098" /LENGTH=65 /DNA_ID=CAMNT_0012579479 /DNA_START=118 /DNA_END=311 /DNA_ORIENTATION=-
MDTIFTNAYEFVQEEVQRRLSGDDDTDEYAVLKGDIFGDEDSPDVWRIILSGILILTFGASSCPA